MLLDWKYGQNTVFEYMCPRNKGADDFQWLWLNAWNTGRDYGVNMSRSNAEWSVMRESYICCCLCESNSTFSNTYLFKDNFHISVQFSMKLVPKGLIENNSAYEAMVWGHQAGSQCLSHCWSGSLNPYGATRPQWVSLFTYWNLAVQLSKLSLMIYPRWYVWQGQPTH